MSDPRPARRRPAPLPRRFRSPLAAGVLLLALAGCAGPPSPDAAFLAGLDPAPTYAHDMLADGHWVCGELARGYTADEVIATGIRDGLNRDLYTADAVRAVVAHAQQDLCGEDLG